MEAGYAAAEGFRRADSSIQVDVRPLADGGEGTVEALVSGMNGILEHSMVTGPLGKPVDAVYGIIPETTTAVIESRSSSPLAPNGICLPSLSNKPNPRA